MKDSNDVPNIIKALIEVYGPRCDDFDADCPTCQAWAELQRLQDSHLYAALRAHNSDSAEPMAWTCIAGYDGHFWRTTDPESGCEVNAYTGDQKTLFERRRSALASPPAKGVESNIERALDALRPLYDAVFNDNGDITVDGPFVYEEAIAGYYAYKRLSALTNRTQDDEVGNGEDFR